MFNYINHPTRGFQSFLTLSLSFPQLSQKIPALVSILTHLPLQWDLNQNIKRFIHENAYENIVCEMAAILSVGDELRYFVQDTLIFNTLRPEQNDRRFAYGTLKCVHFPERKCPIFLPISHKFVIRYPNVNDSSLVHAMAWHQTGAESSPESTMNQFNGAYMRHQVPIN